MEYWTGQAYYWGRPKKRLDGIYRRQITIAEIQEVKRGYDKAFQDSLQRAINGVLEMKELNEDNEDGR